MDFDWRGLPQRIHNKLFSVKLVVGLFVFVFIAALMLASKTNLPTGNLFADMALWAGLMVLCGWLIIAAAKHLRRQNFGDTPPREPVTSDDLLAHAISILAGPLLLIWYVPRIYEIRPDSFAEFWRELRMRWAEALLAAVGLLLIVWTVRAFLRYVGRK